MDRQDIYLKTEKGSEEIQNRTFKLAQKLRSVLIMVDGTKSIGALMDQATALGDVASLLVGLEEQGFIKKKIEAPKPLQATPAAKIAPVSEPAKEQKKTKSGAGDGALVDVVSILNLDPNKEDKK